MMVSFMPCCKNQLTELPRILLAAVLFLLTGIAQAGNIAVKSAELQLVDDFYQLRAELAIDLSPKVEDALNKGVPLTFQIGVELVRPRWYWFNDTLVSLNQTVHLSYHALTRQYRLNAGGLNKNFSTLQAAVNELEMLREWQVIDRALVPKKSGKLQLAVRMYLDQTQLPKPLQLNAISSSDWQLDSGWQNFDFSPTDTVANAPPVAH